MTQDLKRELDDVREEVHQGLSDVRQLVEQSRRAVFRIESELANSNPGASLRVAEQLERVTAMAERTKQKQQWLMALTLMQSVVLIGAVAWFSTQHEAPAREPTPPAQAQAPATLSTLTDDDHTPTIAPAQPASDQHEANPGVRKRRTPKRTHAVR